MSHKNTSIEGSSPPPSPPPETEGLEEQAQTYLAEQEKSITHAYNASTITIVVSLLPLDDNPQGRLGVLSVKNDNDAPLFGAPLHEDEVRPLLDALPVAALLETLKALLPQRLKEREEQAKGKGKEQKPTLQGTGGSGAGSGGASTTRPTPPRTAKKSTPQTCVAPSIT